MSKVHCKIIILNRTNDSRVISVLKDKQTERRSVLYRGCMLIEVKYI